MELSDLKIFQTVVITGGISSAATRLNRVPSNITARIKKLESELDKKLFIREKNRLRISPSGEQLLSYANKILSLADDAVEHLNLSEPQGLMRVGSMEAVAASRLSNILVEYHSSYSKVKIELSTNPTGILIDQIHNGELDLALVADPNSDTRIEIAPIFNENLVIVSDLKHKRIKSPKDLGINPTLIGFSARCFYRTRLTDWIKQLNLSYKVVEINSYHALLNCVTAGMGIGLIPEILLEQYAFKDAVQVHQLPKQFRQTTTCAIWRKDSVKPSLLAFVSSLNKGTNILPTT